MATKEGSIRVSLRDGSFRSKFRRTTSFVASEGKRAARGFSAPLSAGMSAARKSLGGLLKQIQGGARNLLTFGGVLGGGVLVKNAMELQGAYRDIAFTLSKLPGATMTWEQVQAMVSQRADETGQKSENLARAFHSVVKATGNLSYSAASVEAIGTAATASGEDTDNLATAAELMQRKFNVGNSEIKKGLATFLQLTGSGGKSLDELTGKFAVMAGEASSAGMQGVGGLQQLLGLLVNLDSTIGEKADPGLKMMFQTLKKGSTLLKRLQKEGGVKFQADTTGLEKIRKLLTTKKSRTAAELVFTSDARQVFDTLARPFDAAFKEAQEKGLKYTDSVDAGLRAFDENLRNSSRVTMTWEDVVAQATNRMRDDPSVKLRRAIEKVENAFAQPDMIEAINVIADKLPLLAQKLSDLIEWATDNPWSAVAAGVGIKVGGAAVGGVAASLGAKGMAKVFGGAAAKTAAGAAGAAGGAGGAGASGAASAAGTGLGLAATGVVAAGAAGAGIGYAGHKYVFDKQNKAFNDKLRAAEMAVGLRSLANQKSSIQEKRNAIEYLSVTKKNLGKGKYNTENIMGTVAAVLSDVESPGARLGNAIADLAVAQEALARSLNTQLAAQDKSADGVEKFARELNQAGDSIRSAFPSSGGGAPRGGNRLPAPKPGAEPVRG